MRPGRSGGREGWDWLRYVALVVVGLWWVGSTKERATNELCDSDPATREIFVAKKPLRRRYI